MTVLSMWTIYDHPLDYPEHYVARRFEYDRPTLDVLIADRLDDLRGHFMKCGLVCVTRADDDEPAIVETWL